MSRFLLGRRWRAMSAAILAVLTMALVAIPMIGTASADSSPPPSTTTTATPSGGSAVTYTGAGTPLSVFDGQVVAIHVARTGTANVFGIQARICKGGASIANLIQFSPGQTGLCAPAPLEAGTDNAVPTSGLQPAGDAPTNTFADVSFTIGAGTTDMAGSGLSFANFTCGVGNPCELVIRESTSDANGDNYLSYNLTYASAPTVPAAPAAPTATAGNGSASVSWVAPNNGGSAITDYVVTPYIGGVAQTPIDTGSTSTSKNITGLTNFTAYTFSVHAVNGIGPGGESPQSTPVTPAPPPAVITGAQAGNGQVSLTWSAAGGSPTSYSVTSNPVVAPPAGCTSITQLTCTFTGLTNGTLYTFVVTANYPAGTSPSAPGPAGGISPLANFGSVTQTFTLTKAAGQLVIGEACALQAGNTPGLGSPGNPAYPDKPYLGLSGENCNVTLGALTLDTSGSFFSTTGNIDTVTVRDQRDTDVGWHVDAALTPWTDAALDTFGACSTGFTPAAVGEGAVPPYVQTITSGTPVAPDCTLPTNGYGSTHTVASGAPSHGLGDADINGPVLVHVPVSAHSGTYSAVMTFTLFTD